MKVPLLPRLLSLVRRRRLDRELEEELASHLEELTAALIEEGTPPNQARRDARLRLGGARQIRESTMDVWRFGSVESWLRDLRLAARALRRQPVFAIAAIATFALAIGAATAIFSVTYGIAFRPLPYPDADRIIRIYEANAATNERTLDVSKGTFQGWRESVSSIEHAALFSRAQTHYVASDPPQPLLMMSVSPRFFDVLGVAPAHGRSFKAESDYTRFTTNEIVLSHRAWLRLFGGTADIIGRSVVLVDRAKPLTVVGVMPVTFAFEDTDAWQPEIVEVPVARVLRSWRYDRAIARIRPDASISTLRAELAAVSSRLAAEFPSTNQGWSATVERLRDATIGAFSRASWLLIAAVGAVLLVACANVAGLLTARALGRVRETHIRSALGAGLARLAQLWLCEAAVLASVGAAGGLGLAWLLIRALRAAAPAGLPRIHDIAIDLPVLAVTAAVTILCAIFFALVPLAAMRAHGRRDGLRPGAGRHGGAFRRRISTTLVAVQCGAAVVLVILAAMFTQSFVNLTRLDLGWTPDRVLGLDVAPRIDAPNRRPWFLYAQWADRLTTRLEATPGIVRAAVASDVPFSPHRFPAEVAAAKTRRPDEPRWPVELHIVTPAYFDVLGIRLVRGRLFSGNDRFGEEALNSGTPPAGIAVISASLAHALWPNQEALGQIIRLPGADLHPSREVVGIVDDVQFTRVTNQPAFDAYVPWFQGPTGRPRLLVKTADDPLAIVGAVRTAILTENRATVIDQVTPVQALIDRATSQPRVTSRLVAMLGALALILAAVGVYGALATLVRSTARETAVRIALGASPAQTWARTLGLGLVPVAMGSAAGLIAGALVVSAIRGLLFGVNAADVWSYALAAGTTGLVAVVACLEPASRAARTQPLEVLRGD